MTTNLTSPEIDIELNAAADLLQKVAEDAGIDLETLPEEGVAELLHDILNTDKTASAEAPSTETTAAPGTSAPDAAGLTAVDISLELTKRAAAESLDLTTLTAEEYKRAFDVVAAEMADPTYGEKVAEAEKVAQELAHMDEMGRVAARGFYDELNKLAAEDEDKGKGEEGKGKMAPPFGKKPEAEEGKGEKEEKGEKKEASLRDRLVSLAKTAGAQPQAPGNTAKVAFLQTAAQERAAQILLASGIDPATGTKLASDEEIEAAAVALLKEKGYQL